MTNFIDLIEPGSTLQIFGVRFVGLNFNTLGKLSLTIVMVFVILGGSAAFKWVIHHALRETKLSMVEFWAHQVLKILTALFLIVGVTSVWFDDPARLTTAFGLMTAGLAFALQKVITAFAGYIVILRGKIFNVGDRITIGGVRGDVIALDFTQTTLMEMGEPSSTASADSRSWVRSRQFTGRIVRVTNAKIFDEPVYNYTREFPYIWEEIMLPIAYKSNREKAEQILLDATAKYTRSISDSGEEALSSLESQFYMKHAHVRPKVFYRLTDNWLELSVRFLVEDHGVRDLKDLISREILRGLEQAKIEIASATYDIVGFPPIKIERASVSTK